MAQQIPIGRAAIAGRSVGGGITELAPDLAYKRIAIVNVVFAGAPGGPWVLIDAGLPGTRGVVQRAASRRFGANARPEAIVLTHGHVDHVGTLESLAGLWDVPVYAHPHELPYLNGTSSYPPPDPHVGGGLMAVLSPLFRRKPVNVKRRLHALPEDGSVPAMPGWRWLHTPGHAAGHVSLFRDADRTLVAGDAFVTTAQESAYAAITQAPELHGPPKYFTPDWQAARNSVQSLAALQPELAVTGHGRAVQGAALRDGLARLAADFDSVAVPAHGRYVGRPARAEDQSAYFPA